MILRTVEKSRNEFIDGVSHHCEKRAFSPVSLQQVPESFEGGYKWEVKISDVIIL